ncbi:FACT complex subunit SSRP1-like [Dendronephthya gigantea]|uniref:FACT complex subunit SSRP1-like n=1 Tax=Dendronephthya gigantea TaxID=151771 RepID=UPI00106BD99F|nr:FACT complex subunit SSRP1-like [Dendronephthya gigantea]
MSSEVEFSDICLLVRGCLNSGKLKLHKTGVVFKNNKTGKVEQLNSSDLASVKWMKVAFGYEVKFILNTGAQFKLELGSTQFTDSVLSFDVDNKPAFEIPLKDVSAATTGKNEVTLEFHQHDDAEIALMEMRFYVPPNNDGTDADPVKTFHEKVLAKADVIQATGDAIVTFEEVAILTPRGRYTTKIYPSFLQLHGKTYDYKIPYTTILRIFLLPHRDNRFVFFVISTDPPIKQGQTRYPFIIFRFDKDEEVEAKLNLTEEELTEKYKSKLSSEMNGPIHEVMSRLIKAVTGSKITIPGTFKSHSSFSSISCSYKAGSGFFYPLERGFMFVPKPPVHIRFDEISCVNFARVQSGGGTSSRSFDFEVEHKNGSVITFSSIDKEEYSKLFDFVSAKNLKIKNKGIKKKVRTSGDYSGSDEEEHDAYLEQMKAEGAERNEDDSDSEDGSDASFNPGDEDEKDVREEYASDVSPTDSEDQSDESEDEGKSRSKTQKEKKKGKEERRKTEEKPKKDKKEKEIKQVKSKKRVKKDPNAPKKALSAYMLWLNQTRDEIKKANPGISITELSKKAGVLWKALEDKSKWNKLAAEAKVRYEEQMKEYKDNKVEIEAPPKSGSSKKSSKKMSKSSPKKEDTGKFKSAEFVDTDDSSSEDETAKKQIKRNKKETPTKSPASKNQRKKKVNQKKMNLCLNDLFLSCKN